MLWCGQSGTPPEYGSDGSCNDPPEEPEVPVSYPSAAEKPYCAGSCPCPAGTQYEYRTLPPFAPFLWNECCGRRKDLKLQFSLFHGFSDIHRQSLHRLTKYLLLIIFYTKFQIPLFFKKIGTWKFFRNGRYF